MVAAGISIRRLLLPAWRGAPARVAEVVGGVAVVVLVGEALGTVGEFRRGALVAGYVVVAAALVAAASRRTARASPSAAPDAASDASLISTPRAVLWELAAAVGVWAIVFAEWGQHTAMSLGSGILDDDTVAYHLTFALRFVQTGFTTRIPYFAPDLPTDFFPSNSELIHGVGLAVFGRDLFSPMLNLGWMSLVLLAAWCIGQRWNRGLACVLGAATVLAVPILGNLQAGTAQNDTASIFLLLAAITLLVYGGSDRNAIALSGLAIGLAVGTKMTIAPPAAFVAVGVYLLAPAGRRIGSAVIYVIAALIGGGYWYARNLIVLGNPVPNFHLGPLPAPHIADLSAYFAISHYLTHPHIIWHVLHPALAHALGDVWPLVLLVAVAGAIAAAVTQEGTVRLMGSVAALAAIVFVFTPSTALGPPNHPALVQVTANLRYLFPALVLALVALPLAAPLRDRRLLLGAEAVLAVVFVAGFATRTTGWRELQHGEIPTAIAFGAGALVVAGLVYVTRALPFAQRAAGAAVLALVIGVALLPVEHRNETHRYTSNSPWGLAAAFNFLHKGTGTTVGVDGFYELYPLAGASLSNRIVYLGVHQAHGGFTEASSCAQWQSVVNAAHVDYVVIAPYTPGAPVPRTRSWMSGTGVVTVGQTPTIAVYRLSGTFNPTCG